MPGPERKFTYSVVFALCSEPLGACVGAGVAVAEEDVDQVGFLGSERKKGGTTKKATHSWKGSFTYFTLQRHCVTSFRYVRMEALGSVH